jgi:hypothetical protein
MKGEICKQNTGIEKKLCERRDQLKREIWLLEGKDFKI